MLKLILRVKAVVAGAAGLKRRMSSIEAVGNGDDVDEVCDGNGNDGDVNDVVVVRVFDEL